VLLKVMMIGRIRIRPFINARTEERNEFMTSLMYHKTANLTLESLLSESPDEIFAVAAERRLFKAPRYKLVILDEVDVLLSQSTSTLNQHTKVERVIDQIRIV